MHCLKNIEGAEINLKNQGNEMNFTYALLSDYFVHDEKYNIAHAIKVL